MIRIGLLGAGYLGKIHLRLLQELAGAELAGFYDSDPEVAARVSAESGVAAFPDAASLIQACDALDIVTPTVSHYAYAEQGLRAGRHLFIEKPLTASVAEGRALAALAAAHPELVVQVGHVERFNPAFLAVQPLGLAPRFIEGHRLAPYNPRGTDVSVVLDLMIHDLDIVLSLVRAPLQRVSAAGVSVISDTPDLANARLEFENGCVANLTASRISMKPMRRLRLFQHHAYVAMDFLTRQAEVVQVSDQAAPNALPLSPAPGQPSRYLVLNQPPAPEVNSIGLELESFVRSIRSGTPPPVPLADGLAALEAAWQIIGCMAEARV